jgi:hypothetical protein
MEETKKETEDMKWWQVKWQKAPINLTETEISRLQEEQKQERLAREKDLREIQIATEKRNAEFWSAIVKSCSDPEVRDANYIIRAGKQNLFVETMMPVYEKQRRINQLRRLHYQTGHKEKLNLADYMAAADLFVSDPIVRKGDIVQTRRSMFPENKTETTVGGEQ